FIAKADRDLDLYMKAESTEQWTDNLLNFSNALVSLEDWTFVGEQKDAARWRAGHRGACPEHALIALIALIGKHRDVSDGRYRSIRLQSINEIAVWTEEAVPGATIEWIAQQLPMAEITNIRTNIDDDEIKSYTIFVRINALLVDGTAMPLPIVMKRASRTGNAL